MILFLTAKDQQDQLRKFSCQLDKLDDAFEVLNSIVAMGDRLIEAYILDEGIYTHLPPEAFDGKAILEDMRELDEELNTLLLKPLPVRATGNEELIGLTKQRVKLYKKSIAVHQLMIRRLESLVLRTKDRFIPYSEKSHLITHYESLIKSSQCQLVKVEKRLSGVLERLTRLYE